MPAKVGNHNSYKHGGYNTRLYRTWIAIKSRCFNSNETSYKHYGARGISVCPEWLHDFAAFRDYALSHGYADNLTIDRLDNDSNYEPGNIRFIPNSDNCCKRHYDKMIIPTNKLDLDGNFLYHYSSIMEASRQTGVDGSSISAVCRNKRKTAGGYKWVY